SGSSEPPATLTWNQARAELHYALGEAREAAGTLASLREAHEPRHDQHHWMRPWMLSLLLAQESGEAGAGEMLRERLADFVDVMPLSACLEKPDRPTCLALPRPGFDLPVADAAPAS